jgi:hypothetical protein
MHLLKGHPKWTNRQNERNFLDWLGQQLGFKEQQDWYKITQKQIELRGGYTLLKKYGTSLSKLVMSIYTEFQWDSTRFSTVSKLPTGYWDKKENRVALIKELTEKLHIEDLNDWYRISKAQIYEVHKYMAVFKKVGLEKLLQETFPNHKWNSSQLNFRSGRNASQRWVKVMVQLLFPLSGNLRG